jgi:hypothetical protein
MGAASIPIQQFLRLFAFKPGKTNYLARFTQEMMQGHSRKRRSSGTTTTLLPLPADRFPLAAPDVGTELALSKGND